MEIGGKIVKICDWGPLLFHFKSGVATGGMGGTCSRFSEMVFGISLK